MISLSRFFARATLRRFFGRWGWLPLALLFLLAYSIEARASETRWYALGACSYYSGTFGPETPICAAWSSSGFVGTFVYGLSTVQAAIESATAVWGCPGRLTAHLSTQTRWWVDNNPPPASPSCTFVNNTTLRFNHQIQAIGFEPDCEGAQTCWEPPVPYECPASGVSAGNSVFPIGSSAAGCLDIGDGNGCSVSAPSIYSKFCTGPAGSELCRQPVQYTGGLCDGSAAPPAPPETLTDNTCTVVAGQLHCWSDASTDCQVVNGERWCFSDVELQPIVTLDSQVLAVAGSVPVVDDLGDPVSPDSTVLVTPDGGSTTTVNHYNSSTVTQNNTSGSVSGNPAQSGTPGTGTVPGTGDGPGGDGDGEGTGSASGGDTCGAMPVCDGDPVGCAVLAQAWRQRCVEEYTGDDIAGFAGESSGTTLQSLSGELVEGDGSGLGIQSVFSDFFNSQGGDWWARGATCVTDPVITLPASFGLSTLTIELSRWCAVLAMLGQLILALAWLQALRILVGAV